MLTCEKMFERPKAKAVTGPQTPVFGSSQVFLQCIHLPSSNDFFTETRNIRAEYNPLCTMTEQFPEEDSAVIEETGIFTPKDSDQVTSSYSTFGRRLTCWFVSRFCTQTLPASHLKNPLWFTSFRSSAQTLQSLQRHFSRAPHSLPRNGRTFSALRDERARPGGG